MVGHEFLWLGPTTSDQCSQNPAHVSINDELSTYYPSLVCVLVDLRITFLSISKTEDTYVRICTCMCMHIRTVCMDTCIFICTYIHTYSVIYWGP